VIADKTGLGGTWVGLALLASNLFNGLLVAVDDALYLKGLMVIGGITDTFRRCTDCRRSPPS